MSHPFRASAAAVADRAFAQWGEAAVYTPPSGAAVETVAIVKTADVVTLDPRARARQTGRKLELKTQDVPERPVKGATVEIGGLTYSVLEDAKSEDAFSLVWVCRVSVFRGRRAAFSITLPPALLVASAALGERPNEGVLAYTLAGVTLIATTTAPVVATVARQLSAPQCAASAVITAGRAVSFDGALPVPAVTANATAAQAAQVSISLALPSLVAFGALTVATQDAVTVAAPTLAAAAANVATATLGITLAAPAVSASAATTQSAALAITLDGPSLAGHAQQATGPVAELAVTLAAPGASATAIAVVSANTAPGLPAPAASASALIGILPYAGVTLALPSLSATAKADAAGALSIALPMPSVSLAGGVSPAATNAVSLAAPSVVATALSTVGAAVSLTLAAPGLATTATVLNSPAISGNAPAPTASGAATAQLAASAAITLAAPGVTATGTVASGASLAVVRNTGKKSGSNVASLAGSFAATPTVGNLIVVLISGWQSPSNFGVTSVTDNQGNTYSRAGTQPGSSGFCRADIWYAKAATSSGTFTITVNCGSASYLEWVGVEVSGQHATTPFDKDAQANSATGDAATGNTAALSQAAEIVFAVAAVANDDTNINITTPSGYTNLSINQDANATIGHEASYKIVSATTAVSASWSHDNTVQDGWSCKVATFKAA